MTSKVMATAPSAMVVGFTSVKDIVLRGKRTQITGRIRVEAKSLQPGKVDRE